MCFSSLRSVALRLVAQALACVLYLSSNPVENTVQQNERQRLPPTLSGSGPLRLYFLECGGSMAQHPESFGPPRSISAVSPRLLYLSPPHPACSVRRVRRLGLARTLVESTLEDENGDGSPMSKKSDSKSNNGGGNAHQRRQAKRHPQSPDVEPAQQHALGEALSPVPSSERNPTPEPARSGWAHVRQVLGGCFVLSRS